MLPPSKGHSVPGSSGGDGRKVGKLAACFSYLTGPADPAYAPIAHSRLALIGEGTRCRNDRRRACRERDDPVYRTVTEKISSEPSVHLSSLIMLRLFGLALFTSSSLAQTTTFGKWCGKYYQVGAPIPDSRPEGSLFEYPKSSDQPLLDFRCVTASSLYISGDDKNDPPSILVDTNVTYDVGQACECSIGIVRGVADSDRPRSEQRRIEGRCIRRRRQTPHVRICQNRSTGHAPPFQHDLSQGAKDQLQPDLQGDHQRTDLLRKFDPRLPPS
jgi:hypothetical protein